jgi:putative redox protein
MSNTAKLTLVTVDGERLRFDATAGSGQATVVDSGPGMVAPSPVEMLLVSLAGCTAMDVISILRKKRQRVARYDVEIRGERRPEHPKAFTHIEIVHRLHGHELSDEAIAHAIDLSHTKYCSVQASLDPAIVVVNRHEIVAVEAPGPASLKRNRSPR